MSAKMNLISIGRITSALPKGLVLGNNKTRSSEVNESKVIITSPDASHLQSFILCTKVSGDQKTGFLASDDLEYVLKVISLKDNSRKEVHYIKAPSGRINKDEPFPTWVTPAMMFQVERTDQRGPLYRITSNVNQQDSTKLVMDVDQEVDEIGTAIIVCSVKSGVHNNQLFKLEKEPRAFL